MIVKNEAARIGGCLDSVQSVADEIVVVDTGSTDQTEQIARMRGAQVYAYEWQNDFAAARNFALTKASQDWILVLDGDERLAPQAGAQLKRLLAGQTINGLSLETVLALNLIRQEVGANQSPYTLVARLFRNRADICFARPYHETIDQSVQAILAQEPSWRVVDWPQVALLHEGYTAEAIATQDKFNRAKTSLEGYLAHHPDDAYICNKLGALYTQTGDWQRGSELLQRGLAAVQAANSEMEAMTLYELHYHLGLAQRQARALPEAMNHYQQAIAQPILAKLKLGAYLNLGAVHMAQKQVDAAITCFRQATVIDSTFAIAFYNLGIAYRTKGYGYLEPAIAAYQQAIALQPAYAAAYQNLGVALFKLGKLPESLQAFQQAIALYEKTDPAAAAHLKQELKQLALPKQ